MRIRNLVVCVAVLAPVLASPCTPDAFGQKKSVKTSNEWRGSVADEKLAKDAPSCITSAKVLEQLWKDWQIPDPQPKVDFAKELVVVSTTRGSRLTMALSMDEKGDLKIGGIATLDLGPGFRYVIATADREGVKTVNGKELPK